MWVNHDHFVTDVRNFWGSIYLPSHSMYVILLKLKMLCTFLHGWNKLTFGHLDQLINVAKQNLYQVQSKIES